MPYTLDDLAQAKDRLEAASGRVDSDRSNNPDKGRSDLRLAGRQVELILMDLKAQGVIEKSEREKVEDELDRAHPNAKSKAIVDHDGKRYQRRFTPAETSLSGKTVKRWHRWWEELRDAKEGS